MIVPKITAPGEPPKRLCVDYHALNSLLPPVKKAHSKAKGVLTLVLLPKIDEIYARLQGLGVYSTLDMRSGYHHLVLSKKSKPKSAFVTPLGKLEFKRCPFGLAQAPAYFQRLINKVLVPFDFAFRYLDDILVFSPDIETHLQHLDSIFARLQEVGLKLKKEKCSFIKAHIQYLGHIISREGITPVPEKLDSIDDMPPPRTPKEVKQFLGLVGYYRKFIPQSSDIARPLNALTRKDHEFMWDTNCEQSFQMLKQMLTQEHILVYPDPSKPYVLFTDDSKYALSCVLTQEYVHEFNGKEKKVLHPITYMGGLFKGSQNNWACLTKEAYAIYMSIKKLAYYLEDADITLRSDHLPLKKFLGKNTLNSKVNNWAVEISPFRIAFEYIKGIKNTLVDMMSRLIEIDPQIQLTPEEDGFEFGYYAFDVLPPIEVHDINDEEKDAGIAMPNIPLDVNKLENLVQLQLDDPFCKNIVKQLNKGNIVARQPYFIEDYNLHRIVKEHNHQYKTVVIPRALIPQVLHAAHNLLGNNGIGRTYAVIK